jgi:hypothetical protein
MSFSGPRIPSGPNKPDGNQFRMAMNIMNLPNVKCIKCDHEEFALHSHLKMISPMQSPSGQWTNAATQWWKCCNCGYMFNPDEWVKKHESEKNSPIVIPPAGRAD